MSSIWGGIACLTQRKGPAQRVREALAMHVSALHPLAVASLHSIAPRSVCLRIGTDSLWLPSIALHLTL